MKTIHIDSHGEVSVRANLSLALQELRNKYVKDTPQPVSVWADAICINQDDKEEQAQQVSMMQKVYAKAKEIVAWIPIGVLLIPELSKQSPGLFCF